MSSSLDTTIVDNTNTNKNFNEETKSSLSLDDMNVTGTIKLLSKDGESFEVEKKNAFTSNLIKTSMDTDITALEIPLPGVKGKILKLVLEYMNHHKGTEPPIIEKPLRSKQMKDVCKDSWDAEFIDKTGENRQYLYDLILAANYLDVKSLLHLGCAKVASLIKGQPLERIKDILSKDTKALNQNNVITDNNNNNNNNSNAKKTRSNDVKEQENKME